MLLTFLSKKKSLWMWPSPTLNHFVRLPSMTQGTQVYKDTPIRQNITRAQRSPPRNRANARYSLWANSSLHDHVGETVGNRTKRCRKWRQLVTVCVPKHMSIWLVEIKTGILVWLLSSGQKIKWTGKCEKSKMKGIISLSWFRYGSCSL